MNRITGEAQPEPSKTKECLLRQILTKDFGTVRYRVGAIDATIFDLASLLGFTKKTKEHLYSRGNMLIIFRKAAR